MKLELFQPDTDKLADVMRAAVQAEGLLDLVGSAKTAVRQRLAATVLEMSEATGTRFTAKLDGWSAQFTDPQPKPHVADRAEFVAWWVDQGLEHETVERVVVTDHATAADTLRAWCRGEPLVCDAGDRLAGFGVVTETVLPEDPFGSLVESGRCRIVGNEDDGWTLIDTETGETVPGVDVTRKPPELRLVPKDKTVRAGARRDVADRLGLPAELHNGGA